MKTEHLELKGVLAYQTAQGLFNSEAPMSLTKPERYLQAERYRSRGSTWTAVLGRKPGFTGATRKEATPPNRSKQKRGGKMVPLLALVACCAIVPVGLALAAFLGLGRKGKSPTPRERDIARPARPWYRILPGWNGR